MQSMIPILFAVPLVTGYAMGGLFGAAIRMLAVIVLLALGVGVLLVLAALGVVKMNPVLLGGLLCGLVGLFLLIVIIIAAGARSILVKGVEAIEKLADGAPAAQIQLQRRDRLRWRERDDVNAAAAGLNQLGFVDAGLYDTEQILELMIWGWFHPIERVWAVIYDHPQAGVWVDIVARYDDGTSQTFSNSSVGGRLDPMPGHEKRYERNANPASLWSQWLAARPATPAVQATAADFAATFERAYADEMAWRNSRGSATVDEIRRIAEATGKPIDVATAEYVHALGAASARRVVHRTALERFRAENPMDDAKWAAMESRLVVIHDGIKPDEAAQMLAGASAAATTIEPPQDAAHTRDAFARMNLALPPHARLEMLGSIRKPFDADVYLGSDLRDMR